jgi:hypothetical protein
MFDLCSPVARVICGLALLGALTSLALSIRLLRYLMRQVKRMRDRADLERRIIEGATHEEGDRLAILPRAPHP